MTDELSLDEAEPKPRVCLPRGRQFGSEKDLPTLSLICKSTYISRPQIHALAEKEGIEEDTKNINRRLRDLVRLGLIVASNPVPPFVGTCYSISRSGLIHLERSGKHMGSISSESKVIAVPNQKVHFLMLGQIRVKWQNPENDPVPEKWTTDREVKALSIYERTEVAKDYDGVLELPAFCGTLGIEYEQFLKTSYVGISEALNKEKHVKAVLYFANSPQIAAELLMRIRTTSFPVGALAVSDFLRCQGSVYDIDVLCQASTDGPVWECSLRTFLLYSDKVHGLDLLGKNSWDHWFKSHHL